MKKYKLTLDAEDMASIARSVSSELRPGHGVCLVVWPSRYPAEENDSLYFEMVEFAGDTDDVEQALRALSERARIRVARARKEAGGDDERR